MYHHQYVNKMKEREKQIDIHISLTLPYIPSPHSTVHGECVKGFQKVHYITPSHCRHELTKEGRLVPCSVRLSFLVEVCVLRTCVTSTRAFRNQCRCGGRSVSEYRPNCVFLFVLQVIVLSAVCVALLPCLLLFCLWKKNQRLEYKYMKLVAKESSKVCACVCVCVCATHVYFRYVAMGSGTK